MLCYDVLIGIDVDFFVLGGDLFSVVYLLLVI